MRHKDTERERRTIYYHKQIHLCFIQEAVLSGLAQINESTAVPFTQEPPVPNVRVLVVFSSTDALEWTKREPTNDLPDTHRDTLLCVEVEVARVVQHVFRSAEIHKEWKPHCGR